MRYATKIDWWIMASVLLAPIGVLIAALATRERLVVIIAVAIIATLVVICWPCDYTLEDEALVVRSGLIKWRVPYKQIEEIQPTRSSLSSPAFSMDRILVRYGRKSIMISPVRKDEFMTELRIRAKLKG